MNHLTNLQKAIGAQHLDALLLHDRQSKRYVGALPGSGVYVVVTPTQAVQIHDGRYRAEAEAATISHKIAADHTGQISSSKETFHRRFIREKPLGVQPG